jgi:hypothetical protein
MGTKSLLHEEAAQEEKRAVAVALGVHVGDNDQSSIF